MRIAYIPIVWKYFVRTVDEFKYVSALALMPVWLGALISLVTGRGFFSYLNLYFENGEALLLCAATVGPLLYIITKDDDEVGESNRPFPGKTNFIIIIVVICVISAAILGVRSAIKGGAAANFDLDILWWISTSIATVSLFIWFLVNGIRLARETGAPSIMRQGTEDFAAQYRMASDE